MSRRRIRYRSSKRWNWDWRNSINYGGDEVTGNPLFTDFSGAVFTLQAGSTCRDVGLTGLGYTVDYAGNSVPSTNIDIGCYQNN